MIYETITLEVWYQHSTLTVEIKNKIRTSFKSLVSKKARTQRFNRTLGLGETLKKLKKQCIPVVRWNKKHLLKHAALIIYKLENILFCSCYFSRSVSCQFADRLKKPALKFGLKECSSGFQKREDQVNTLYEK